MINAEIDLLMLTGFLLSMITLAACRGGPLLSIANAACMICSTLLGQALTIGPGILINTAGLYSTVALIGVGCQVLTCSTPEAYRTIGNNLFALGLTLGSMFVLEQALILSPLFESRIAVAGARFSSCYLVQSFFIYALNRIKAARSLPRFIAVALVAQAMDVVVFFPTAFIGTKSLDLIAQYAMGGLIIREGAVVLSVPFLLLLMWLIRRGYVGCPQINGAGRIPA